VGLCEYGMVTMEDERGRREKYYIWRVEEAKQPEENQEQIKVIPRTAGGRTEEEQRIPSDHRQQAARHKRISTWSRKAPHPFPWGPSSTITALT